MAEKIEEAAGMSDAEKTEEAPGMFDAEKTEEAAGMSDAEKTEEVGGMSNAGKTEEATGMSNAGKTEEAGGMSNAEKTDEAGGISDDSVTFSVYFIPTIDENPAIRLKGQITIYTKKHFEFIINEGTMQTDTAVTVSLGSLRYVDRHNYGKADPTDHGLIISYLAVHDPEESCGLVKNVFIEAETSETIKKLYEEFYSLLESKFRISDTLRSDCPPSLVNNIAVNAIFDQPLFMGKLYIEVRLKKAAGGEDGNVVLCNALCVVDMECLCIYKCRLEEADYCLRFWQQPGDTVVEKIVVNHYKEVIEFETATHFFTLTKHAELLQVLSHLKPKPKNLLAGVDTMLVYATEVLHQQAKKQPVQSQAVTTIAALFGELQLADMEFMDNEAYQAEWAEYQCRLNELELSNSLPESDFNSTDLEVNNEFHLLRVLDNIKTQISFETLPMAVSTMKACRQFFSESENADILRMFIDMDANVIKNLYFSQKTKRQNMSGMVEQRSGGFPVTQGMWNDGFEVNYDPGVKKPRYSGEMDVSGGATAATVSPDYRREALEHRDMTRLQDELEKADHAFQNNEDFQAIWTTFEFDLQELEQSGDVPESDFSSGGLDSGDVQHLRRAMSDIQGMLQEGHVHLALSRMRACRQFFKGSPRLLVRRLFEQETDHNLLRKLYFRSMVM